MQSFRVSSFKKGDVDASMPCGGPQGGPPAGVIRNAGPAPRAPPPPPPPPPARLSAEVGGPEAHTFPVRGLAGRRGQRSRGDQNSVERENDGRNGVPTAPFREQKCRTTGETESAPYRSERRGTESTPYPSVRETSNDGRGSPHLTVQSDGRRSPHLTVHADGRRSVPGTDGVPTLPFRMTGDGVRASPFRVGGGFGELIR